MDYANLIFNQMGGLLCTEITLWNAMVRGYAYNGPCENCLSLFDEMTVRGIKPNNFTYPYVINACSQMGSFLVGQKVHGLVVKSGFGWAFSVGNSLFDFYVKKAESLDMGLVKIGSFDDARKMFDEVSEKTVELWNKMIGKYAITGDVTNAKELFDEMPKRDVVSWNTMISTYAKAGDVENASDLFQRAPQKNVVTWTTMLGAYAAVEDVETAHKLFEKMPARNGNISRH
ncbi:PREDICTED: pentatricopeptide repeat-containing protein At1g62260, mitochondrial-like [Erythranthe guttata]|uniref:pentatricopeptide repeat-containing protein At1g62260, mitochondrial-like n=1 Tax=Erythranthe guttata TaxID=4155 RepID=UPI00064D72B4|nr:PREDICTED: pentatricopeptide repeat-containing protein At1g62260, mitochondrial-like [Erythranthe guttata]|eukprot:XP_012851915.1 PREDICTED: pentatricopeptide repeat-containing protein At1g62260, mitochondrial-like [Erythranthe guttata]